MAGAIASHHGWQSFFWLETALSGVSIILIALTFPETKYHRSTTESKSTSAQLVHQNDDGSEEKLEKQATHTTAHESGCSSLECIQSVTGRPSRSQYMPFQRPDPRWKIFVVRDTWTPVKCFFNPIILWAG